MVGLDPGFRGSEHLEERYHGRPPRPGTGLYGLLCDLRNALRPVPLHLTLKSGDQFRMRLRAKAAGHQDPVEGHGRASGARRDRQRLDGILPPPLVSLVRLREITGDLLAKIEAEAASGV